MAAAATAATQGAYLGDIGQDDRHVALSLGVGRWSDAWRCNGHNMDIGLMYAGWMGDWGRRDAWASEPQIKALGPCTGPVSPAAC